MQLLAHLAFWFGTHALYCMPGAALLMALTVFATRRLPGGLRRGLIGGAVGLAVLTFATLFVGSWLTSGLVYRLGENGRGEVVSSYATGTQVNNHDVVGYRVLLRTQAGQVVQTSFEDDDFNVYPPASRVRYPGVGDAFTARYLPAYPQDFVIVTNDTSPYAHRVGCARLLDSLHEARRVYEFDRGHAASKQAYLALIHRVIGRGCYTDSTDLREYYGDLAAVQLEPCRALLDSLDAARTRYNADLTGEPNRRQYLVLIRRVMARPPCYTDSTDLREYRDDLRRVQASYRLRP